jgi:hypothetical protein
MVLRRFPGPESVRVPIAERNDARHKGHAYFWQRALNRRQTLGILTGAAGLAFSPRWTGSVMAAPSGTEPRPIPGGIQPLGPGTPVIHFFLPGSGNEPSLITDFNGAVGVAEMAGSWSGGGVTPPAGGLNFGADIRFMQGEYIG